MKMKRVLACALSAAMIVTFVSFGNMGVGMVHAAVDIENESVTVEESGLCRCWRRSNSAGSYVVQRVIQ